MASKLTCKNIKKFIKKKPILSGINLQAEQGQIVALLGPNGSGKTTTFSVLCGLIRADEGELFLDDIDIKDLPMYKRSRLGIGYLPQEPSVFRGLTVEENIYAVLEMRKLSKTKIKKTLDSLLKDLSLERIRESPAVIVSGGERRKLEIARALAADPKFILLDEPFAGIDPLAVADMKEMINILKSKGIGVIITDHNVRDTLPIADYAYLLFEGKVLVEGTPSEIINNEKAKKLYLGKSFSEK
jgi:lipopolysaccharide export system ATP-binding protein